MPSEENLLVLKMLQDGTITADQASELLQALTVSETRTAVPAAPAIPIPPAPPALPELAEDFGNDEYPEIPEMPEIDLENDAFSRARARIAAARERVAGVQEKLGAAEEKLEAAATKECPRNWEQVADALREMPAARSVAEALRGIEPGRIAATARRRARRMARQVRSSIGDLDLNLKGSFSDSPPGEPTLSIPREATTALLAGGTLRIKNTLGAIEAQGADVPEARIAGVLRVWASDAVTAQALADQIQLVVEPGPDGPSVRVRHPDRVRRVVLDLKVFLPAQGTRLSLLSLSGDLTVRGLSGGSAVVLATQSGDARVTEIGGDAAVDSASGEIILEGVQGNVTTSSSSGDIRAIRINGQNFRATTQSGDVALSESGVTVVAIETVSGDSALKNVTGRKLRVRAVSGDATADAIGFDDVQFDTVSGYLAAAPRSPLTGGTFALESISGDADLRLPSETDGKMEVSTKSGDVDARFLDGAGVERIVRVSGMVRMNEAVGNGNGAKITVSTISGDLTITQDGPVIEIS